MKPPKKPVKAIKHKGVKRAHIPSAEEAGYEAGSDAVAMGPDTALLPLNPVLTRSQDPELFWMHKYPTDEKLSALFTGMETALKAGESSQARTLLDQLRETLQHRYSLPEDTARPADIRSLYRHEHISPEALMKSLYRVVAKEDQNQPDLFSAAELFGNAISHEELDKVSDYYTHSDGWTNRLIQGDSHLVMTSLLEREGMAGQVQCIYIDPPYGIKYGSNWQIRLNNRTVNDGKDEDLSGEPEQIKAFRDTWELGIHSYLSYLRDRLLTARELLHDSGSCFVQISDENVHLVRNLMDEVFGSENFVSLITFKKTAGQTSRFLPSTADYLIWYSKSADNMKFRGLHQALEYGDPGTDAYSLVWEGKGKIRPATKEEKFSPQSLKDGFRFCQLVTLHSERGGRPSGEGTAMNYAVEFEGRSYRPPGTRGWTTTSRGMAKLIEEGRVASQGNSIRYVRFFDDFPAKPLHSIWEDTQSGSGMEKCYVVQTNHKIIQRCMLMTTDPGDLVLDPTCGSGTTAYVAEQWGRRWITIDTSRIALNIAKTRLLTASFPFYQLYDQERCDIRQGFVYKKVPHITLGSIANNEPAKEETLYDQPQEDRKRLRVAGPFTVETLQSYEPISPEELARQRESDAELANFEDLIFEHLRSAGVKTGDKRENAVFTRIDRLSHAALHAEGWYPAEGTVGTRCAASQDSAGAGAAEPGGGKTKKPDPTQRVPTIERKAYLHIGPKFGTVSKQAVTEAIKACRDKMDGDWLIILGFAFESGLLEVTKKFGAFQVSLVRMHDDLMQQGLMKKDKKAASFVTIGEPDIRLHVAEAAKASDAASKRKPDGTLASSATVEIAGMDIYDPIKDQVKARDVHDIAYWMVDDDYDGSSFVVRQVFFCGGEKDEFDDWKKGLGKLAEEKTKKKVEQTLKIEIEAEAFSRLYGHRSHPFPVRKGQKIAVRVISQFGEETTKVLEV
jgi:adenine-specific DNA-methyltransferase